MDTQHPKHPSAHKTHAAAGGHKMTPHLTIAPTPGEKSRHDEDVLKYPTLGLSAGEYVIEMVKRHPIGILSVWFVVILLVMLVFAALPAYSLNRAAIAQTLLMNAQDLPSAATLVTPAMILVAFFILGGVIATIVYNGNRFYLTNESIIQHVQYSLFDTKQQVVNLINVEDASADQTGIIEQIFNYGTLRISTQGEETIYHFRFVANPNRVVHVVNSATEVAVKRLEGFPPSEY